MAAWMSDIGSSGLRNLMEESGILLSPSPGRHRIQPAGTPDIGDFQENAGRPGAWALAAGLQHPIETAEALGLPRARGTGIEERQEGRGKVPGGAIPLYQFR